MKFKLLILITLLYSHISNAEVRVFKHCNNNKGYGVSLPFGKYTLRDLKRLNIKNDDISALEVSNHYYIRVYKDNNFRGASRSFHKNDNCLVNNNFNDKISSIEVGKLNFGRSFWQIRSMQSDKCLDVQSNSTANGANVYLYTKTYRANQMWKFIQVSGNEYKIVSKRSGKCLDVNDQNRNDSNVDQHTCRGGNDQLWIVSKKRTSIGMRYQIKSKYSGKCLTSLGTQNGSNVVHKTCTSGINKKQLWRLKLESYRGN